MNRNDLPGETPSKTGLRGGGPTLRVPGSGNVRRQPELPTAARSESVQGHAEAMESFIGGPSLPHGGRPDRK